jgi:drug/metabolite transporter (DMT)-like permease
VKTGSLSSWKILCWSGKDVQKINFDLLTNTQKKSMVLTLYLVANICVAALFKLFPRYKIDALHAIVVNYTLCFLLGVLLNPDKGMMPISEVIKTDWFKIDLLLGVIFISGFTITAKAIQQSGITLTTMMQKMSILVSVTVSVMLFHEPFGGWQILGLCFAVGAIIAINQQAEDQPKHGSYLYLAIVLLSSAAIEVILLFVERNNIVQGQHHLFTSYGFGVAAVVGWIIVAYQWISRRERMTRQDWIGGLLLGLPNFLTIYFLLLMLNQGWNGSVLFPVLNVTVLALITLTAWLVFKEKLRPVNWLGIVLAVGAILLIGLLGPHG